MAHEVQPLHLVRNSEGYRCTVHCPVCGHDLVIDAEHPSVTCPCGAGLRIVVARVLHGTRARRLCIR